MSTVDTLKEPKATPLPVNQIIRMDEPIPSQSVAPARLQNIFYALALLTSISVWFLAIRSPLWLDETHSYWQISAGFSQIPSRTLTGLYFPAYFYLLWLVKTLFGSREIVLRIPSVLAMATATYFLYRSARELFDADVAMIATIMFCLQRGTIFMSIEVRPYAFGVLATTLALFTFIRWTRTGQEKFAALFGVSAALILYFQYVFGVILPAFALWYVIERRKHFRNDARQLLTALACFVITVVPVIPRFHEVFATRATHVIGIVPPLALAITPFWPVPAAVGVAFLRRFKNRATILLCASIALIPVLILYAVTALTSVHIYLARYTTVATPGVALCWGLLVGCLFAAPLYRQLICLLLVGINVVPMFLSPDSKYHSYTWKYALEFADKAATADHAPLLICSDFPESNFERMPTENVTDDITFAPLVYYKVNAPVIPLPRALNSEAERVGGQFIDVAAKRRQRFLALAFRPSYPTLHWLSAYASQSYISRPIGDSEGILVFEFVPKQTGP